MVKSTGHEKLSRVCTVAQYAVFEAKAKVNGRGPFSHPTPPKPLNQLRCHIKYIAMSPHRVDIQNLVGIDSAVTDLRMREKTRLCVDFLINISICLPVLVRQLTSIFWSDRDRSDKSVTFFPSYLHPKYFQFLLRPTCTGHTDSMYVAKCNFWGFALRE